MFDAPPREAELRTMRPLERPGGCGRSQAGKLVQ
jgi:hypothetical protein